MLRALPYLLIALPLLLSPGHARAQDPAGMTTYRLPFQLFSPNDTDPQPTRKLVGSERVMRAHDPSGGGVQVSTATEYRKSKGGGWRRASRQRIDYLRDSGAPPRTCSEAAVRVLHSMLFARMDERALRDMAATNYITEAQKSFHRDRSLSQDDDVTQYFDSVATYSPAELKAAFAGTIPWGRVVEVNGPPGLSPERLRALVEAGDPRMQVRLFRATLRITATGGPLHDQQILGALARAARSDAPNLVADEAINLRPLHWEHDPQLTAQHQWDRFKEPIGFELGRASLMDFSEPEELRDLVRLALIQAAETVFELEGGVGRADLSKIPVYMHSNDAGHTRLYERAYGAKVVAKVPYKRPDGTDAVESLLRVDLATALEHTGAGELLEIHRAIREANPEGSRTLEIIGLKKSSQPIVLPYMLRGRSRARMLWPELMFGPKGRSSSQPGKFLAADNRPILHSRQVAAKHWDEVADTDLLRMFRVPDELVPQLTSENSLYRVPAMPRGIDPTHSENGLSIGVDYLREHLLEGEVLSNLDAGQLAAYPDYLRGVLVTFIQIYDVPYDREMVIVVKDSRLRAGLETLGFRHVAERDGFQVLRATRRDLPIRNVWSLEGVNGFGINPREF